MKTKTKILIGSLLFITLYMGALSVYSFTFIAPGTTIDPACPPTGLTACTVHVLGFDSNGFLDTGLVPLLNSSTGQLYIGDNNPGGGSSGPAFSYQRGNQFNGLMAGDLTNGGIGDQTTWAGYLEPGVIENSLRANPTNVQIGSTDGFTSSYVLAQPDAAGIFSTDGSLTASGLVTLNSGFVIKGKDDLSTSQNFKLKSNTDVELVKVMNDGTFTATRTVPNGTFVNGNFEMMHPLLGVPVQYSGSLLTLSNGATVDMGAYDIPSLPAQGAGQHYIDNTNNIYLGFDFNDTDSSMFNFNTLTNAATAVTVNFDDVQIVASPDGVNLNRIMVNNNTDGIVFTGLDDLTSSVLVNFENDSGDELMQLKNDGSFTNTRGNFSLVNNTNFGSPASGAMIVDGVEMFTSGVVDLSGLGGGNTSGNFYFNTGLLRNFSVVTGDGVHLAVNSGLSQNTSFSINATGGDAGISGDIAGALFSVFNVGSNSVNNVGMIIGAGLDDSSTLGPSTLISFEDGTGDVVGSITFGSSATAYNTTSDQRLKENIVDTALSIELLDQIQIRDFTWIGDAEHKLSHGVIAQELYNVYPLAVTKPINESVDKWMVDYSKLVPLVVKSIQDLDLKLKPFEDLTTVDNTFAGVLRTWLASTGNGIAKIFSEEVQTNKLCVGSTCVTESEFLQLIQQGGVSSSSSTTGSTTTTTGSSTPGTSGSTGDIIGDTSGTGGTTDFSSTTGDTLPPDEGTGSTDTDPSTGTGDTGLPQEGSGETTTGDTPPPSEEGGTGEVPPPTE